MANEAVDVYAAGSQLAGAMCWVCQKRIMAGDEIVFCPHDHLPSHAECWEANDGCPVYGCQAGPAVGQVAVQALGTQTGDANYLCPKCRKMVKPNFLQCTLCGTPFALESVVSGLELEDYEHRRQGDLRRQGHLWTLFFLAATGILAPLVLLFCGRLLVRGTIGRFRLRHLFRDSRVLFYATVVISAVYTVLMLLLFTLDRQAPTLP